MFDGGVSLGTMSQGVTRFIQDCPNAFEIKQFIGDCPNAFEIKRFIGDCPMLLNEVVYRRLSNGFD